MKTRNFAARAGHWSAQHRKVAILGWIAFVIVAFAIGSGTGLKKQKDENRGNGDSRTAAQVIAKAGLKERASEQVLVQARGSTPRVEDASFRKAVGDVRRRLSGNPYVVELTTPYQKGITVPSP